MHIPSKTQCAAFHSANRWNSRPILTPSSSSFQNDFIDNSHLYIQSSLSPLCLHNILFGLYAHDCSCPSTSSRVVCLCLFTLICMDSGSDGWRRYPRFGGTSIGIGLLHTVIVLVHRFDTPPLILRFHSMSQSPSFGCLLLPTCKYVPPPFSATV